MVHFHKVGFQLIFCIKGWVDVVYEDQGPPIRLTAGDCFIQPPEIRHRVLMASDGIEVIEIGVPAEHVTEIEHDMDLPTPHLRPDREWQGQRFVHNVGAGAEWRAVPPAGLRRARDDDRHQHQRCRWCAGCSESARTARLGDPQTATSCSVLS